MYDGRTPSAGEDTNFDCRRLASVLLLLFFFVPSFYFLNAGPPTDKQSLNDVISQTCI